ncbi:Like-Sm ribonucleoprotein, eukaryotic and archaea-type, core [sediment metagenome]|uniref:Like-Sm ribonucleoprotein, eukaryotic and archaea-type, core n=1 Tax=sediment metagenome TaxID=749907 RepID=D9PJQ4_9ZZZZ
MENGNGNKRPLDVLGSSLEKNILVKTKFGDDITGILKAFDSHINIWMDEARMQGEKKEVNLGKVLIRGDNIVLISPAK